MDEQPSKNERNPSFDFPGKGKKKFGKSGLFSINGKYLIGCLNELRIHQATFTGSEIFDLNLHQLSIFSKCVFLTN